MENSVSLRSCQLRFATTEVIPIREIVGVSDKFFLFYYLLLPNVRILLAGKMQGTTGRQRLNKDVLVNLEIPLPPLPEQRAIAYILQTIQEAKFTRQREIALERERKAALMEHLFSHGTKGEPRKQTETGEIPESWEVVRLEDACHIIMGQSPPSTTYNNEGIGMPFLQGKAEFTELFPAPTKYCTKRPRISPIT